MYDRLKNQYIFKLSNGRTINFFYKENTGLCASLLNKRNMWTESILVLKDCERDFSADIDKNNNIHILLQDLKGNLSVIQYYDSSHIVKPLLGSKSNTSYNKHLNVLCSEKDIYFFYVIDHNGNKLLSYQTMQDVSNISQPKVIDYCIDSKIPYCVFNDNKGSIIVFYYSGESKHKSLGFKIIDCAQNTIGEFIPISENPEYASILGGSCDSNGVCHFLWDKKRDGKYELCYANKIIGSENLLSEQILSASVFPHLNSSIVLKNSSIICYWTTDSNIYFSASEDGMHFSVPEKYSLFDSRPFYCITFKNNTSDINSTISGYTVPGNFTNGYRLAFSDSLPFKIPNTNIIPRNYEHPNISINNEDILTIKADVKKLNDKINEIEKKVKQIETSVQMPITTISAKSAKEKEIKRTEIPAITAVSTPKAYIDGNKTSTPDYNETLNEKFKYLESKFVDDFVQDPRIEEIKKEIASHELSKSQEKNQYAKTSIVSKNEVQKLPSKSEIQQTFSIESKASEIPEIKPSEKVAATEPNNENEGNNVKSVNNETTSNNVQSPKETPENLPKADTHIDNTSDDNNVKTFKNYRSNYPIMPGSGFSQITAEYLRKLGQKIK